MSRVSYNEIVNADTATINEVLRAYHQTPTGIFFTDRAAVLWYYFSSDMLDNETTSFAITYQQVTPNDSVSAYAAKMAEFYHTPPGSIQPLTFEMVLKALNTPTANPKSPVRKVDQTSSFGSSLVTKVGSPLRTISKTLSPSFNLPSSPKVTSPLRSTVPSPQQTRVKIVSYNILSSDYAVRNEPMMKRGKNVISTKFRFPLLKKELDPKIAEGYIFCLQEISAKWLQYLIPYFQQNDYTVISSLDSYLNGNIIAFPNTYKLEEVEYLSMPWEIKKLNGSYPKAFKGLATNKDIIIRVKLSIPSSDPNEQKAFNVYCLHAPTDTKQNNLYMIFLRILLDRQKLPQIVAGDFNMTPSELSYNIINGLYPNDFQKYKVDLKLKSLYLNVMDEEPQASHVNRGLRRLTLDYIFYQGFDSLFVIAQKDIIEGTYPNLENASDHLMIGGALAF
jgi:hypothetical protein